MASFDLFKTILAKNEGGYQNLIGDSGNYNSKGERVGTNFGISARFYESILKRPPTVADMKALTLDNANKLYKIYFWDAIQGDSLVNQSVANIIADHAVNGGELSIAKPVQLILRNKFKKTIVVDGDIGPATAKLINSVKQATLFDEIKNARLQIYANIGGQFLNTWINRLNSFFFTAEKKKTT
jgi:lysozyme family protein